MEEELNKLIANVSTLTEALGKTQGRLAVLSAATLILLRESSASTLGAAFEQELRQRADAMLGWADDRTAPGYREGVTAQLNEAISELAKR
jgi:hypothetical protein